MSADNGIYILKTPRRDDPEQFEYRVAHAQAIENVIERDAPWAEIQPAYAVVYFGDSTVFDHKSDALLEADIMEDEALSDDCCPFLEYGICEVQLPFDGSFPDMSMDEAKKDIDAFNDPGQISNPDWCG